MPSRKKKWLTRLGVLVVTLFLASLLGLVSLAGAVDSDGDLVPDSQDRYPNRNDLKYGGTLTLARDEDPQSMDFLMATDTDQNFTWLSESGLMTTPDGDIVKAGWIESYDVSPDGKIWTFHIKKGIKFQDGTPLTAKQWAWLLRERIRNDAIWSTPLRFVESPDDIKVYDKYTLQIVQSRSNPNLKNPLTSPGWLGGMRPPHAIEKYGEKYGKKVAYGNGPFKMKEWVRGDHLTLVRNEDYTWGPGFAHNPGPPYLKKVKLIPVPEASTRYSLLKAGEVDGIVEAPLEYGKQFEKMKDIDVYKVSSTELYLLAFNTTKFPFKDIKVRKAINYGIDRNPIVKAAFYGYGTPAYSAYLASWQVIPGRTLQPYKYNPEKAKNLLAEAGWADQNGDGILEKNGKPLRFELSCWKTSRHRKIAEVVQGQLRKIGIDVEVHPMDEASHRAMIRKGQHKAIVFTHEWPFLDHIYWWTNPDAGWYPGYTGIGKPGSPVEIGELRKIHKKTVEATTWEEFKLGTDDLVNFFTKKALYAALVRPKRLFVINKVFANIKPRGAGYWGWVPYLYDVYRKDVYRRNLEKWKK